LFKTLYQDINLGHEYEQVGEKCKTCGKHHNDIAQGFDPDSLIQADVIIINRKQMGGAPVNSCEQEYGA
jgi:hypothetical protein